MSAAPEALDTPGVVAGYRLLAPLGRGASATVYRALGPADATRPVALKLLQHEIGRAHV